MLNKILSLTKSLISIPSTRYNKKALNDVLDLALKEVKDFTIERFEKDGYPSALVYSQKTKPNNFKIILNAHLDVVSGREEQYKPYEKDGKLFGRGAIDMKGAAAVEILVFKEVAKKVSYPLALQLVTDEEIGGFCGTKYQIEKGVRADFVIAGEPTDFGVNNKAKGIIWLKIKTKGKAAHGAYPWLGNNALWRAKKILDKIEKKYPVPKKEAWQTTFNLAKIETGNQTFNKVPDEATISFDIRYIPEEFYFIHNKLKKPKFYHSQMLKQVQHDKRRDFLMKKLKKIIGNLGEIEIILFEPPQFTDEKNFYLLKLKEEAKKVLKKNIKTIVKHSGSDIRHFNQVGCQGVTFGPIGGDLHGDNEWVDIKSLENYYLVLFNFLRNL
jgi:succinyl-diaminopimelate desuccinylase